MMRLCSRRVLPRAYASFSTSACNARIYQTSFKPVRLEKSMTYSYLSVRRYSDNTPPPTAKEITERVIDVVKKFEKVDPNVVNEKSHFIKDLGLDSLDNVELVVAIEEEFTVEIPDEAADKINSIPDAVGYLVTNPHVK